MRASTRFLVALIVFIAASMALVSASATAATVQVTGTELQVIDDASAAQIDVSEFLGLYQFDGTVTAGTGCIQVLPDSVTCPTVGLASYQADLGDGDDSFRFSGPGINLPGVVLAGPGDDFIRGNSAAEEIRGGPDNDSLNSSGGGDQLSGENGDDRVSVLGAAGEELYGGSGSDIVASGAELSMSISLDDVANDGVVPTGAAMVSSDFEDVYGSEADDILEGDNDPNQIRTGGGSDAVLGLAGADWLRYTNGETTDVVQMLGGDDDDFIQGGVGADDLQGGSGNDIIAPSTGTDVVQGGLGTDLADYSSGQHGTTPLSLTIGDGANDGATGEGDDIQSDVENLYGGQGDDVIVGDADPNGLVGFEGDDQISGLGGDDALQGDGSSGVLGDDVLIGGPGADNLFGNDGDDVLDGGAQADFLDGNAGVDTSDYSARTEAIVVTLDNGVVDDGAVLEGDEAITENVITGSGDDQITGSPVANLLDGADGNDVFHATDGVSDQIECGPGTDDANDSDVIDVLVACDGAVPAIELDTQIDSGPPVFTPITTDSTVYTFSSPNDPGGGVVSFICALDNEGWQPCSSPWQLNNLAEGDHYVQIRAMSNDPAYLDDESWATTVFTVDLPDTPPVDPPPVDPPVVDPPVVDPPVVVPPVVDPIDRCALRTARARVFVYSEQNKIRLVVRYKSQYPAKVTVSYKAIIKGKALALGKAKARFSKKGLYRLELRVSKGKMSKIRSAKSFTASMSIPGEPRYCARAYERKITKRKVVAGQVVFFQKDSGKISMPKSTKRG